jgi:hypothetical protein
VLRHLSQELLIQHKRIKWSFREEGLFIVGEISGAYIYTSTVLLEMANYLIHFFGFACRRYGL